ncbi:MAG: hypothetical protein GXO94_02220 [Nitrospirae bacterium]|nr:hypothetical protein [Nitrospirota bacterium]
MRRLVMKRRAAAGLLLILAGLVLPDSAPGAGDNRTQLLEQKVQVLVEEVQSLKEQLILPEAPEYEGAYGLGPSAARVYGIRQGVSLAGYGEAYYRRILSDKGDAKDTSDFYRFVLYAGYRFTDRIIFNSEFEIEHAATGKNFQGKSGSVAVEFAYLDFFFSDPFNVRAGLVLVPMGFVNELHEPTTFHGVYRPDVEQKIIPSTWRKNGLGVFGTIGSGVDYRIYVVNGMNGYKFSAGGIRNGRQKGGRVLAEDLAVTGRLDWSPTPGILLGGAFFAGNSGQDQTFNGESLDIPTTLLEAHAEYRRRGLAVRVLGVKGSIGDAGRLSAATGETIGSQNYGWYIETAYDVMPLIRPETTRYLAPFIRYEHYNTQYRVPAGFTASGEYDVTTTTVGLTYKPIPQVAIKADYRNVDSESARKADEFNLGIAYAF